MRAGRLRHRIKLQQKSVTKDYMGTPVDGWVDVLGADSQPLIIPAEIVALSGNEFIKSQAMQSKIVARITIRTRDVLPTYRIKHRNDIYQIESVLPDAESGLTYLTIMVSRGVNQGQ